VCLIIRRWINEKDLSKKWDPLPSLFCLVLRDNRDCCPPVVRYLAAIAGHTIIQISRHTDRQAFTQISRHTDRQALIQISRHTDRHGDR
jgi:hypothetical protein